MFPPFKKLHTNISYQLDFLKAAMGPPRNKSRKSRRRKLIKSDFAPSPTSSFTSLPGIPPTLNDPQALSAYIMEQMAIIQTQQEIEGFPESSFGTSAKLFTGYLPNFMWYQLVAADSSVSSMIRPTSLCSGTGITGDQQYLNPDMLNVFHMFGSYFLGSGHLFQDDGENDASHNRRSAFWIETIPECDAENDSSESEETNSSYMTIAGSDGSDSGQMQKDLIERVIEDLRCSQIMMTKGPRIWPEYEIRDSDASTSTCHS